MSNKITSLIFFDNVDQGLFVLCGLSLEIKKVLFFKAEPLIEKYYSNLQVLWVALYFGSSSERKTSLAILLIFHQKFFKIDVFPKTSCVENVLHSVLNCFVILIISISFCDPLGWLLPLSSYP